MEKRVVAFMKEHWHAARPFSVFQFSAFCVVFHYAPGIEWINLRVSCDNRLKVQLMLGFGCDVMVRSKDDRRASCFLFFSFGAFEE